jgi:hypothetical protein
VRDRRRRHTTHSERLCNIRASALEAVRLAAVDPFHQGKPIPNAAERPPLRGGSITVRKREPRLLGQARPPLDPRTAVFDSPTECLRGKARTRGSGSESHFALAAWPSRKKFWGDSLTLDSLHDHVGLKERVPESITV